MDWQEVESTNIRRIAHYPDAQELHVEFHNGKTYKHSGVDARTFDRLLAADSHGSHYNRHIRGHYPAEQV
jgi:hypothetical protein